jgi:hypothetical protein
MIPHGIGLRLTRQALAQPRDQGPDAGAFQVSSGTQGIGEFLTRHESFDCASGEGSAHEVFREPFAAGRTQEDGSGDGHGAEYGGARPDFNTP